MVSSSQCYVAQAADEYNTWFSWFISWLNRESSSISSLTDNWSIEQRPERVFLGGRLPHSRRSLSAAVQKPYQAYWQRKQAWRQQPTWKHSAVWCSQSMHSLCTQHDDVLNMLTDWQTVRNRHTQFKILMDETWAMSSNGGGLSTCCHRLWFVKIISTDLIGTIKCHIVVRLFNKL